MDQHDNPEANLSAFERIRRRIAATPRPTVNGQGGVVRGVRYRYDQYGRLIDATPDDDGPAAA